MTAAVVRACCRAGLERGMGYAAAVGSTAVASYGFLEEPGPVLAQIEHTVEERVAWHEAAHAVLGYGFGWHIACVSIIPRECVTFVPGIKREPFAAIVNALAGPAGEDARIRSYMTEPATLVTDFIDRVRQCEGGQCDQCRAALNAWHIVGTAAPAELAVAKWREGEQAASDLLALPSFRAAVEALVDRLMVDHVLPGSEVELIISQHVEFGSLDATGKVTND